MGRQKWSYAGSLGNREPHYDQEYHTGKSFPCPTTISCQKSLSPLRPTARIAAQTWVGPLWNIGNGLGIWGMDSALGMIATQYMPGQQKQKQQPYLIFPHLTNQLQLEALFPGSCWSGSGLLRLNSAQHWFCPRDCRAWHTLCALAVTQHLFPFLPH